MKKAQYYMSESDDKPLADDIFEYDPPTGFPFILLFILLLSFIIYHLSFIYYWLLIIMIIIINFIKIKIIEKVISSTPLVNDPYENKCVYVKKSSFDNAGEGLFAKTDLPADVRFPLLFNYLII
jgi:hypothetical protein